jgi:hypothetical protein
VSRDILETIDGAIGDWETSDDAMRWQPAAEADPAASILAMQAALTRQAFTAWQEAFAQWALDLAAGQRRIVETFAQWSRQNGRTNLTAALEALAAAATETPARRTVSASEEATGGSPTDQPPSLAGARFDSGVSAKRDRPAYVTTYGPAPKRRVR